MFCGVCLKNKYGMDIKEALKDDNWWCPPCMEWIIEIVQENPGPWLPWEEKGPKLDNLKKKVTHLLLALQ